MHIFVVPCWCCVWVITPTQIHTLTHSAPNLGEDNATDDDWEKLPKTWPDYLDNAVRALNNHLLPSLKFTPKELLLGLVIDTKRTELTHSTTEPSSIDAATHMAYVAQQRLDGYDEAVHHAIKRKMAFD